MKKLKIQKRKFTKWSLIPFGILGSCWIVGIWLHFENIRELNILMYGVVIGLWIFQTSENYGEEEK